MGTFSSICQPPGRWVGLVTGLQTLLNRRFQESGMMNTLMSWEGGAPREDMEALFPPSPTVPRPMPCPMHRFHLADPSCILYNQLENVNKVLSWVLWVTLVNYWTWRGWAGTSEFVVGPTKMWVAGVPHLCRHLKWGWSCRTQPLTFVQGLC